MNNLVQLSKGKKNRISAPHNFIEKHRFRERKEMANALNLLSKRRGRLDHVRKLMIG